MGVALKNPDGYFQPVSSTALSTTYKQLGINCTPAAGYIIDALSDTGTCYFRVHSTNSFAFQIMDSNTSDMGLALMRSGSARWQLYCVGTTDAYSIYEQSIGGSVLLSPYGSGSWGMGAGISTVAASAVLDLQSTAKGFLPPRMTTAQKNAISSPSEGLMVYDLTLHHPFYYNGSSWVQI